MLDIVKNHPRLFLAEWQKLKRTPALYLLIVGALFTATIVFIGHSLDVHHMVKLNMNPWERYFNASISIFALFLIVPFLVLFVSAATYIEQQANGWKFLYTLPYHRGQLFFAKLFSIITLLLASIATMLLAIVLSAYLLNFFRPEYEFTYFSPDIASMINTLSHSAIACLGIVGWQYLLSLRFKNFLFPLGIGILGFITALLLSLTSSTIAPYIPYSYPMLVKDFDMFKNEFITEDYFLGLNNIESYSIMWFFACTLIALIYESRKNITD